jgi:hypothetical protein
VSETLNRLADEIRGGGGLLAHAVTPASSDGALGDVAAAGNRAAGQEAAYALLVEAIREGYLQHYGEGRVVRPEDPDLALLAGDVLYALGLARLADLGDLEAVTELADVISLAAQAHAEQRPGDVEPVWEAGVAAVGHGPSATHARAKALARAGAPAAPAALRECAEDAGRGAPAPGGGEAPAA